MGDRRLIAVDCETDPFLEGRVVLPFIWGAFDGKRYRQFYSTDEFVAWLSRQFAIAYAHNGGKFDFMYLMPYLKSTKARIIGGRIAEMNLGKCKLRDSFSIMPVPLGAVQKEEIAYWKMHKDVREEYKEEIEKYLESDCVNLFTLVSAFRKIAGTRLTIASNALQSSRKLGANPGRTNWRFDREFREYYFGGRTEVFQPGAHDDIKVIDIVSSYPYAMMQLHPCGDDRGRWRGEEAEKAIAILKEKGTLGRAFIHLKCDSKGAFPKRSDDIGELNFPHGVGEYKITGWEYLIAEKHNLISDVEIISVTALTGTIDFRPYIDKWFGFKNAHDKTTRPVEYTIGKIMQNALYGKMAQDPSRYFEYEIHKCGTKFNTKEGWSLYAESFMGVEIHRRSTMWKFEKKYGQDWKKRNDLNIVMDDKECKPPKFYNVATGASITGFARAHLLDAMHMIGVENAIYCDTDSLTLKNCDISMLRIGKQLGAWESEGEAIRGYFAGKKLYAMKMKEIDPKTGKNKYKIASKGCKISYDEMISELDERKGTKKIRPELGFDRMRRLCEGEEIKIYHAAPSFSLANGVNFPHRILRATARMQRKGTP